MKKCLLKEISIYFVYSITMIDEDNKYIVYM